MKEENGTAEQVIASFGARSARFHQLPEDLPLLGRERELEHLSSAWSSTQKWFTHPPVIILGEPGVGKTRLIEHFLRTSDEPDTVILRLSNSLWDQPPLGMWQPLMGRATFDPYGTVMDRLRNLRTELNVILCIEDLHWADDASLKLLDQLHLSIRDIGVLLLLTSRSEPPGSLAERCVRLTLTNLEPPVVESLVEAMLGKPRGGDHGGFVPFIMDKTGGNPLLTTELVLYSLETGAILRNGEGLWFMNEEPTGIIPHSAESVLRARLGSLKPGESYALQVASVLGNTFSLQDFTGVYSELGWRSGEGVLSGLMNMGFIVSRGEGVCGFSSSILSGTVYRTLTPENRRLIHKTAAAVLSGSPGKHDAVDAISLARHWIESETGEQAVPWLMDALEQCLDLGDVIRAETLSRELHARTENEDKASHGETLAFFDARLQLIMGKFQLAYDSLRGITESLTGQRLAQGLFFTGQAMENLGLPLADALSTYGKAVTEAEKAGDMNTLAQALGSAGSLHLATGNRQDALEAFSRALEHRDSLDTPSLAKLHGNMGILMHRTGSHEEALKHYGRTLELGKKCGNMGIEANALAFMGQVEINMGNRERGLERYREALALHRKAGNRRGECTTLGNMGGQLARFGDTGTAIEMLESAISIAEDIGHTRGIMSFHSNLGLAFKMSGNYPRAEEHIRIAMNMISGSGDQRAMAVAHLNLCTVLSNMSRPGEAIDEARRALRYACRVNALTTQARALGNLGWLMLKTDRIPLAASFFREAFRRSFLAEDHSMLADSRVGEGRACYEMGKMEEARRCCESAGELKEKYGMDHEAERGLQELKDLLKEVDFFGKGG